MKAVEWNLVNLPDGQEISAVLAIGSRTFKAYVRRVDSGSTYAVVTHLVTPKCTIITIANGTKGPQQDEDHRLDTIQMTRILPDGTAVRQQPTTARVLLNTDSLYAGLSPEQMIRSFCADASAGRFE
jgi:hypothetical protein